MAHCKAGSGDSAKKKALIHRDPKVEKIVAMLCLIAGDKALMGIVETIVQEMVRQKLH